MDSLLIGPVTVASISFFLGKLDHFLDGFEGSIARHGGYLSILQLCHVYILQIIDIQGAELKQGLLDL